MTWKIMELAEASVLHISIYIYIHTRFFSYLITMFHYMFKVDLSKKRAFNILQHHNNILLVGNRLLAVVNIEVFWPLCRPDK